MNSCFSFVDRTVRIQFFETDPVVVTMTVSDVTDAKFREYSDRVKADASFEGRKTSLGELIGHDNVEKILERSPAQDHYALLQIQRYVLAEYNAVQAKNLSTAEAGREK